MTPIERAARALALRNDGRGARWDVWVGDVHTVLMAIREPSDEMVERGEGALCDAGVDNVETGDPVYCWQAMIDVALGE